MSSIHFSFYHPSSPITAGFVGMILCQDFNAMVHIPGMMIDLVGFIIRGRVFPATLLTIRTMSIGTQCLFIKFVNRLTAIAFGTNFSFL